MTHSPHMPREEVYRTVATNRHVVHTGPNTHLLVQVMQKCGDAQVDDCLAQWWHTQQVWQA